MEIEHQLYQVTVSADHYISQNSKESFLNAQEKYAKVSFLILKPYKEDGNNYNLLKENNYVLSKDQVFELSLHNITFKIIRPIDIILNITEQLIELAEKPITLISNGDASNTYNTKCEVHMPGNILTFFNEMLLLEDACTDMLQNTLNIGWRIVAVCPQPTQRRPDYILGRFNPNFDGDSLAKRNATDY